MAVVDEPHGPAGDPRQLGCSERLEAGALLAAEARRRRTPSAPGRRPSAARTPPRAPRGREHPLRRDPGRELVAVPRGDGRVRLERRLQLRRRVELELDRHLGGGESRLGVTPGIVGRVADEALLVDGLLRIDDVGEHLDVERQSARRPSARRLERVGRDDRDRLAGVAGLGGEERSRASSARARSRGRSRPARPAPPAPRRGRASAPVRARPASGARRHGASRRAERRPCTARGRLRARGRRGAARAARRASARRRASSSRTSSVSSTSDPDVLVAALHLLLRANEAGGHAPPAARRMARSIFG